MGNHDISAGLRWAELLAAFIAALSVPLALGLTPDVS
jgi:hypothetical protein